MEVEGGEVGGGVLAQRLQARVGEEVENTAILIGDDPHVRRACAVATQVPEPCCKEVGRDSEDSERVAVESIFHGS